MNKLIDVLYQILAQKHFNQVIKSLQKQIIEQSGTIYIASSSNRQTAREQRK